MANESKLSENIAKVPELIGLWKFRQRGKKPVWCTTYCFEGNYYDTQGKATPEAAIEACSNDLKKLKKETYKRIKNKKGSK